MSASEESLSNILSLSEPQAPPEVKGEPEKAEKTAPPAVAEKTDQLSEKAAEKAPEKTTERDEKGRFAPKSEKPTPADVAAIIDERRKRQALEAKLASLESQKQPTSFFDDPEKAFDERVAPIAQRYEERLFKLSVKAARVGREDYDDVSAAFAEAAESDPKLIAAMREADDPGEYIYAVGKQLRELSDVNGDIVKYREKVTAEAKAQLDEQQKKTAALETELAAVKKQLADLSALPRSTNALPSGASPKTGDEDPEDIRSIVRFNQRS